MKKIKLLGLAIIGVLVLSITSCVKEPTASFTMSASSIAAGESITFTNTSTDGETYSWDFGDASAAVTETSPTHTFTEAGTYTVTLTAYSKKEKKESKATETVTVTDAGVSLKLEVYTDSTFTTLFTDSIGVALYKTYDDWYNYTNAIGKETIVGGIKTFTDLEEIAYYVEAENDIYYNYANAETQYTTPVLSAGANTFKTYVDEYVLKSNKKVKRLAKIRK